MKPRIDASRITQSTAVASLLATSNVNSRVVEAVISADEFSAMARNKVLREGRCALASAFASYKYMILVSPNLRDCIYFILPMFPLLLFHIILLVCFPFSTGKWRP